MQTVCKLPRLPRKPEDGAEVCDKYGNRWRFSAKQDSWISRGFLQSPVPVTETNDGVVTPDIFDRLQKVRAFVNSGFDLRPLKIAPGRDAYWYYFRSSDKFVSFKPEGEDALRIEVDRGRLFQVLMKQVCPGPRGEKGDVGDRGREGKPGPAEICYEPSKIEKNRLDFSIITPTPLLGDRTDIELPNNHVPDISVRVFKVTLPRRTDGLVASKVGTKPKPGEVAVYDQLQYLAIYYHGLPAEAAAFQATRDLLVKQSMGALAVNVCPIALSRVLALPIGSTVDRVPVVTVLVDPLGVEKPRVSFDRRFPVDMSKTLNTIKYDPDTGIVCGSIYLLNNLPWEGTFCIKSRQRGPDGQPGKPGESTVRITECTLDQTSVFATCPIITARLDCERQAIFSVCSDIVSQVCVEGVRLAPNSGSLNDRSALNTSFAAAQMVLDDCKLIESYTLELVDDEFDELDLAHWTPQPGCVTKRHYDRHKFNWVKNTDIPACDEVVKWYGPNGLVRPGKYPWFIGKARAPEKDECCQEDFFYCPNVQVGCYNTGDPGGGGPPPAPPPPAPPPTAQMAVTPTATPTRVEVGGTVRFDAQVSGGTPPYTWSWSGSGVSQTTQSFDQTFPSPGVKIVTVTVKDSKRQRATGQISVVVISNVPPPPPPGGFSVQLLAEPQPQTANHNVEFQATASGSTPPYSYAIDFGDGTTSTHNPTGHPHAAAGFYTAQATATDAHNAQATGQTSVQIAAQRGGPGCCVEAITGTLYLHIYDGPNVGVYSMQDQGTGTYVVQTSGWNAVLSCSNGYWVMNGVTASVQQCSPFSMSFSGPIGQLQNTLPVVVNLSNSGSHVTPQKIDLDRKKLVVGSRAVERAYFDYSGEIRPEQSIRVPLDGHFNSSIIRYKGRYLLATRLGWRAARMYMSELGEDLTVQNTREIVLPPEYQHGGFDDPRLFVFRGQLHLSFAFIEISDGNATSKQCIMVLGDDYQPVKVWKLEYEDAGPIEKNWVFFEYEGELLGSYTISPHIIIRVREGKAEKIYQTNKLLPWLGGYLRGGTPPVRVGDEYISFLHGAVDGPGRRTYNIGVYAFAAKPPFEVTRITPSPILWADPATRPPHVPPNAIWPAGAIKLDRRWLVSVGVHDWWTELLFWSDDLIQKALVKV